MSKSDNSSSAGKYIGIVIGVVMMVGGWYLSKQMHGNEFLTKLEEQGIPLDPGKTISAIGVFLILFPVIRSFFITPLADAIDERTTSLERTFGEAEDLRSEMTKMKQEYEQRLAQTEANAREQIQGQIREATALRQTLMAEATAKADELVKKAQEEIALEKDKVMTALRLEVVNLTLGATEKILGQSMDDEKNRRLVQEFIEKAEVTS
ncbi:MAG: F0F1 ATP synthase subunit B [Fimbriimonadaceae bacterium]|nr:F0F1 ATP synthase subunit B [Fimbriimonadaceae bacterium]